MICKGNECHKKRFRGQPFLDKRYDFYIVRRYHRINKLVFPDISSDRLGMEYLFYLKDNRNYDIDCRREFIKLSIRVRKLAGKVLP